MLNNHEIDELSSKVTKELFSSLDLEEVMDKVFASLADLFSLQSIIMCFNDVEKQKIFILSSTDKNSTLRVMKYPEFTPQQKACAKKYNFFAKEHDYTILNTDDPRHILFKHQSLPFTKKLSTPLLSHRAYQTKLGGGAVNFCFQNIYEIEPDALELFDRLRLVFHIFINIHFRLWLLEEKNQETKLELRKLQDQLFDFEEFGLIGSNNGLQNTVKKVQQVAPLDITVLIHGSTGTGKEIIAKSLHALSARREKSFVPVNCGAIPPSLIDAELFGYNKGAFTGANSEHRGFFEQANQGTIFLDEIGDLPHEAQVRLLRVLQEHKIQRLGSNEQINLDFRLIAASHKDLKQLVQEGKFREDLFYRLSVISIELPDLAQRKQDIPKLVKHFIQKHSKRLNISEPEIKISELEKLLNYNWPGNIRELENCILEALALSEKGHFHLRLATSYQDTKPILATNKERFPDFETMLKSYLTQSLELSNGKIQGKNSASELLGLHPNTLRKKLVKYNITFGNTPP